MFLFQIWKLEKGLFSLIQLELSFKLLIQNNQ